MQPSAATLGNLGMPYGAQAQVPQNMEQFVAATRTGGLQSVLQTPTQFQKAFGATDQTALNYQHTLLQNSAMNFAPLSPLMPSVQQSANAFAFNMGAGIAQSPLDQTGAILMMTNATARPLPVPTPQGTLGTQMQHNSFSNEQRFYGMQEIALNN